MMHDDAQMSIDIQPDLDVFLKMWFIFKSEHAATTNLTQQASTISDNLCGILFI
jgi:hypothetical protein